MEIECDDKAPIEQLPEEILVHVFEFLGPRDLRESALVCKK